MINMHIAFIRGPSLQTQIEWMLDDGFHMFKRYLQLQYFAEISKTNTRYTVFVFYEAHAQIIEHPSIFTILRKCYRYNDPTIL